MTLLNPRLPPQGCHPDSTPGRGKQLCPAQQRTLETTRDVEQPGPEQEVQGNSSGDGGDGRGRRWLLPAGPPTPRLDLRLLSDKVLSSIVWKFDALRLLDCTGRSSAALRNPRSERTPRRFLTFLTFWGKVSSEAERRAPRGAGNIGIQWGLSPPSTCRYLSCAQSTASRAVAPKIGWVARQPAAPARAPVDASELWLWWPGAWDSCQCRVPQTARTPA